MTTPSETHGFDWYQDHYSMIQGLCLKVLLEESVRFPTPQAQAFLTTLKQMRWYAIASDSDIDRLWEYIRNDDWITDLVINTTIELNIRLTTNQLPSLEEIGTTIGKSVDALRNTGGMNRVDDDFQQRTPDNGLTPYFKANNWLVTCYLISKLDLVFVVKKMQEMYKSVTAHTE